MAETLAAHSNPEVAFLAAAAQIERAPDDQAITRVAEIVLTHERGPELLMGLAWSLMHSGDAARNQDTMAKLAAEVNERLKTASPEVRARFRTVVPPAE